MELKNTSFQGLAWLDRSLFPFESRWCTVKGHRIHYVDVGSGPVILISPGAPCWSFMYRDLIRVLAARCRVVVLDYPGFGISEAARGYQPGIAGQVAVLKGFMDQLGLAEVYLLGHDTGGPSGLAVAAREPGRFQGLILTDTLGYPVQDYGLLNFMLLFLGSWPVRWLQGRTNWIVAGSLRTRKRNRVPKGVRAQYAAAFRSREARLNVIRVLKDLRRSGGLLEEIAKSIGQGALQEKPALLLYGAKDPVVRLGIPKRLVGEFKEAELRLIDGEGHFPHEGCGAEMGELILEWLTKG